jgi:organic hydroperoxide reductase OsmC/OhrA
MTAHGSRESMAEYHALIEWDRRGAPFVGGRYSREHRWTFDEGVSVPASASPHIVPVPQSTAAAVDPEEAFVAALASCHMLFFLSFAARDGFVVESYRDAAVGVLGRNADGEPAITTVTLRPDITFGGERRPTGEDLDRLHHESHEACFIARSVKTVVRCEPAPR